MLFFIILQTR